MAVDIGNVPQVAVGFDPFIARAISVAGITPGRLSGWQMDFVRSGEDYDTSTSGGGLAVQSALSGGSVGLTAPTGAAEFSGVKNSGFTPIPNAAFYAFSLGRVDAGSALTNIYPICLTQTGQSFADTVPAKGVMFRIVNGVMTMRICDGLANVTTVATTWTVETAADHIFEILFDGTTVQGFVDYVQVAATTTFTNLTSTPGMPCAWLNNQNDITVQADIRKMGAYIAGA